MNDETNQRSMEMPQHLIDAFATARESGTPSPAEAEEAATGAQDASETPNSLVESSDASGVDGDPTTQDDSDFSLEEFPEELRGKIQSLFSKREKLFQKGFTKKQQELGQMIDRFKPLVDLAGDFENDPNQIARAAKSFLSIQAGLANKPQETLEMLRKSAESVNPIDPDTMTPKQIIEYMERKHRNEIEQLKKELTPQVEALKQVEQTRTAAAKVTQWRANRADLKDEQIAGAQKRLATIVSAYEQAKESGGWSAEQLDAAINSLIVPVLPPKTTTTAARKPVTLPGRTEVPGNNRPLMTPASVKNDAEFMQKMMKKAGARSMAELNQKIGR